MCHWRRISVRIEQRCNDKCQGKMEVRGEKPVPKVLYATKPQHEMIYRRVIEIGTLLCSNVYAVFLFIYIFNYVYIYIYIYIYM